MSRKYEKFTTRSRQFKSYERKFTCKYVNVGLPRTSPTVRKAAQVESKNTASDAETTIAATTVTGTAAPAKDFEPLPTPQ